MELTASNNPDKSRYEITTPDGTVAGFAEYVESGDITKFVHTVVDPEFGGQGVGSKVAKFALADVRERGNRVIAQCEFIAGYIAKHKDEYADLLA